MGTIAASDNEFPKVIFVEGAAPGTPPAGQVYEYAKADGLLYQKDDTGTESPLGGGDVSAHLSDTTDAHDASAVSFDPTGLAVIAGTEVQTALEELDAAVDTLSGSGATGGEAFMTTPVTMTSANTYYDAVSQSLAAGTYQIWGAASVENANADTFINLRLWDGTTVYHEGETYQKAAGEAATVTVFKHVVLGSTTTVKISACCNKASGTINDGVQTNATADKATKLMWLKIA